MQPTVLPPELPTAAATPTEIVDTSTIEPSPTTKPSAQPENTSLDFGLPELTADKAPQIPEIVMSQTFPLATTTRADGTTLRPLLCVAGEMHVEKIQLRESIFTLASIECWYEVGGEKKGFYMPIVLSDGRKMVTAGFVLRDYDTVIELGDKNYWTSRMGDAGYTGPGHIFVFSADPIDPELGVYGNFSGLGYAELSEIFTEERFEEFGKTGDPSVFGHVIISANLGMNNSHN